MSWAPYYVDEDVEVINSQLAIMATTLIGPVEREWVAVFNISKQFCVFAADATVSYSYRQARIRSDGQANQGMEENKNRPPAREQR